MMRYVLDAVKMQTKEEAHIHLKEILDLPEYYGGNLDALYDVLTDMEQIEVEIQNLTNENVYAARIVKVMKAAGVKTEGV